MPKFKRKSQRPVHLDDYEAEILCSQIVDSDLSDLELDNDDFNWSDSDRSSSDDDSDEDQSQSEEFVLVRCGSGDATVTAGPSNESTPSTSRPRPTTSSKTRSKTKTSVKSKNEFANWEKIFMPGGVEIETPFEFNPKDTVGIRTDLLLMDSIDSDIQVFRKPTELDCFFSLFTEQVQTDLLEQKIFMVFINLRKQILCQRYQDL